MKKFIPLLLIFCSCSIFSKQARFEKKAEQAKAFLKTNNLLAGECAVNFPCVTGDSTVKESFDSSFYINSFNDMQELVNGLVDVQDSLFTALADRDTACRKSVEAAYRICQQYRELYKNEVAGLKPIIKTVTIEKPIMDTALLQAERRAFNIQLAALSEKLSKVERDRDDYRNKFDNRSSQRNILFLILCGVLLGVILMFAFRKVV